MRLSFTLLCLSFAGCTGDDTEPDGTPNSWYTTCGDPVCQGYTGPFPGVAVCSDETVGEPCDDDGAECDLENDCNQRLVCAAEDPQDQVGGCPISKRDAKRDIHYLDAERREQYRQEALALALATWRYREESPDARPHLGFVIDDRPSSVAVRQDGERVDLYGYTSLAIAAIQAQQAEIEALKAKIEALETRLGER